MLGFAVAYVVARAVADLALGEPLLRADRMLVEGLLFVVLSGGALSVAAAIPILRDLTRVQARVTHSEREMSRRSRRQGFIRDVPPPSS